MAAKVLEDESCTLSQPKQFGSLDIWDLMTNIGSSDLQEFGALGGSSGDQLFHQCKDASLGKTKVLQTRRKDEKFDEIKKGWGKNGRIITWHVCLLDVLKK